MQHNVMWGRVFASSGPSLISRLSSKIVNISGTEHKKKNVKGKNLRVGHGQKNTENKTKKKIKIEKIVVGSGRCCWWVVVVNVMMVGGLL